MQLMIDLITFNLTRWCSDFWYMLFQMVLRKGPCSSNCTIVINAALWNKTVWFIQSLRCPCWLHKEFQTKNSDCKQNSSQIEEVYWWETCKIIIFSIFYDGIKMKHSPVLWVDINKVLIWRCRKLLNTNMQKIYW